MATKESPTVKEDGLHASGLPGVLALPHERAKVQSSGWHEWLMQHSKFRFDTAKGSFTAFKSSKGYWTAQRRVDGNLRHQYLGESHTLTYETLEETAQILAAPDYWRKHVSGKGRPRDADKELTQKSHINPYETESEVEEPSNETAELRARLAELEVQFKEKVSELATATNKIEGLEKESRELRYRCSDLERENARLERLGTDYSHASFQTLSAKYQKSLDNAKHWEEAAGSYRRQAEAIAKKREEAEDEIEQLEQSNSELQFANQTLKMQLSECSQKLKEALSEINELLFTKFQVEQKDDYIRELQGELLTRPDPATLIRRKVVELGMQEKVMQHQADPKTNARYWALAKLLEAIE